MTRKILKEPGEPQGSVCNLVLFEKRDLCEYLGQQDASAGKGTYFQPSWLVLGPPNPHRETTFASCSDFHMCACTIMLAYVWTHTSE